MSLLPLSDRGRRTALIAVGVIAVLGGGIALLLRFATHVLAPRLLAHYEHNPALAHVPKRTTNAKGVAADPVNVAIVGSRDEVATAFRAAGWVEPDSLTRASKIAIAKSVLLHRPDSTAPVSPLFLYGRPQDLAFEREVGGSASRRHHVRFWRADAADASARPLWIGGATFDTKAGLSHRGLHPTHHIDPDVDTERDTLVANLMAVHQIAESYQVTGLGPRINARNAEGDRFDTDGEMAVAVVPVGNTAVATPRIHSLPPLVALETRLWHAAHRLWH
ncbi:MAG: hypothetical protein NVS1B4_25830 [Gemmatimonadaceae bacterium]